ncbi:ribosome assembly cofactor RimP [Mycoplasmopsis anatis]|nr:ribosome assembly cofactor RimP [Mycoplasmopsis anatis]
MQLLLFLEDKLNYKEELKKHFGDMIIDAKLTNEFNQQMLEVTVNVNDLNQVNTWTTLLNEYLESVAWFKDEYGLTVMSKGEKLEYTFDELVDKIGTFIKVKLNKSINKNDTYIGEILEYNPEDILLKWNDHGQFRKIKLSKIDINKIEKYIKF